MKACVETYGCSMNFADGQGIAGFLRQNGISISSAEEADLVIFNGCSVKEQTEARMLSRLRKLSVLEKSGCKIAVFGCLAKTCREKISDISREIIFFNDFRELAAHFSQSAQNDSLYFGQDPAQDNPGIAIIPINSGCLNNCTFCSVRQARGSLHSFPIESIERRFARAVRSSSEIWLTSQDTGAYGFDIRSSLPELLEALLSREGDFRIRIGMANPWHFKRFEERLVPLFEDRRLYRFLHMPLQSGSDRVLSLMSRGYTAGYWLGLVQRLRSKIAGLTISTDVIVGFPTETEEEFGMTLEALRGARPDIVNVSRYGQRQGTVAAGMGGQLHGRVKKARSRLASALSRRIALENNVALVGKSERILVSERGSKGGMVGRTGSYKPVVIPEGRLGEFAEVEITSASVPCLYGKPLAGFARESATVKAFNKV